MRVWLSGREPELIWLLVAEPAFVDPVYDAMLK